METAIVSPEFHVAIPQAIREALDLQPGQRLQVILYQAVLNRFLSGLSETCVGFSKGLTQR